MKNNVIQIVPDFVFSRNTVEGTILEMKEKRVLELLFQKLLDGAHCALGIKAVRAVPCADERVAG